MWFKQAAIFQLKVDFKYSSDQLKEKLSALIYRPCLPSMPMSMGWVSPVDEPEAPLVQMINSYMMICLQIEEKILPADVIRQELTKKVKEIELTENRKVRAKEKYTLKDNLIATLLPRAFSKLTRIYAYIDPKHNCLIISTTQEKKLEKIISMFAKSLNEELSPIEIPRLSYTLTHWLKNQAYASAFGIEKSCTLQDPNQQNRVVRCQHQDLFVNGIQSFLKEGFYVKQLALSWHDRVNFMLHDRLVLSGIKFQDEIVAQAKEMEAGTLQQQFIADFLIMSATLTMLLTDLYEALKAPDEEQSNIVTLAKAAI
jgi:recombination associated protein RdgC